MTLDPDIAELLEQPPPAPARPLLDPDIAALTDPRDPTAYASPMLPWQHLARQPQPIIVDGRDVAPIVGHLVRPDEYQAPGSDRIAEVVRAMADTVRVQLGGLDISRYVNGLGLTVGVSVDPISAAAGAAPDLARFAQQLQQSDIVVQGAAGAWQALAWHWWRRGHGRPPARRTPRRRWAEASRSRVVFRRHLIGRRAVCARRGRAARGASRCATRPTLRRCVAHTISAGGTRAAGLLEIGSMAAATTEIPANRHYRAALFARKGPPQYEAAQHHLRRDQR